MRVARCGDSIADNYVKAEVLKNSPLSVEHRRWETGNMSPTLPLEGKATPLVRALRWYHKIEDPRPAYFLRSTQRVERAERLRQHVVSTRITARWQRCLRGRCPVFFLDKKMQNSELKYSKLTRQWKTVISIKVPPHQHNGPAVCVSI